MAMFAHIYTHRKIQNDVKYLRIVIPFTLNFCLFTASIKKKKK